MGEIKPTVTNLSELEAAVLMQEYLFLLGMIHYGTKEQKEFAIQRVNEHDQTIHQYVNAAAFSEAHQRLELEF